MGFFDFIENNIEKLARTFDSVSDVQSKLTDKVERAKNRLTDNIESAKDKISELQDTIVSTVTGDSSGPELPPPLPPDSSRPVAPPPIASSQVSSLPPVEDIDITGYEEEIRVETPVERRAAREGIASIISSLSATSHNSEHSYSSSTKSLSEDERKPVVSAGSSASDSSSAATGQEDDSFLSSRMHGLIEAAVKDGIVTEAELAVLVKRGESEGISADEVTMVVQARLYEIIQKRKKEQSQSVPTIKPPSRPKALPKGKCPHCGAINRPGSPVCSECGKPLPGAVLPPPLPVQQPHKPQPAPNSLEATKINLKKLKQRRDRKEINYTEYRLRYQQLVLQCQYNSANYKELTEYLILAASEHRSCPSDFEEIWEKNARQAIRQAKKYYSADKLLMKLVEKVKDEMDL